jgi:hypothetical protein
LLPASELYRDFKWRESHSKATTGRPIAWAVVCDGGAEVLLSDIVNFALTKPSNMPINAIDAIDGWLLYV